MEPTLTFLNLDKITLYGWETEKSDLILEQLISKVEEGARLPPVFVQQKDEHTYFLTLRNERMETYAEWQRNHPEEQIFKPAAGHYRAITKFFLHQALPAIITDYGNQPQFSDTPTRIQDITIADDEAVFFPFAYKAMHDPQYW